MTLLNDSIAIESSLTEDIYYKEPNLSIWVSWNNLETRICLSSIIELYCPRMNLRLTLEKKVLHNDLKRLTKVNL